MLTEALGWIVVNLALSAAAYAVAPKLFGRNPNNPHDAADLLASTPVFAMLVYYAVASTLQLRGSVEDRWAGVGADGSSFFLLYIARQLVSLPFVFLSDMADRDKVLMAVHHAVSIGAFLAVLATQRMYFYGTLLGTCEISTCFLNAMLIRKAMAKKNTGAAAVLTSVCLWLSFLGFRIVLFPVVVGLYCADSRQSPAETVGRLSLLERVAYPCTVVLLFAMSAKWFVSITRGTLRSVRRHFV